MTDDAEKLPTSKRPIRIVQVSDTHISAKRAYFLDNWDLFVQAMQDDPPDLIVHSGDISFDGASDEDDLAFSAREMARLPKPWIAIPGNHDIGESHIAIRLDQPTNAARRTAWAHHLGPTRWLHDMDDWRLIGIDTALLGCDTDEACQQLEFLRDALARRGKRRVLLFQHMPPYLSEASDAAFTTLAVPHAVRGPLLDLYAEEGVGAIACGHVHVYRHLEHRGMDIVWAPATSFFNIVERQKIGGHTPRAVYLEWTLDGTGVTHRLIEPPLMLTHDVGAWNKAHGSTTHMPPRPAPASRLASSMRQ
jgi:3',5'-cyclic AMP phosphodiesterase CpdA